MKEFMKFSVGVAIYGGILLAVVIAICIPYSWYTGAPVVLNSLTFGIALIAGTIARDVSDFIEDLIFGEDADQETEIEKR